MKIPVGVSNRHVHLTKEDFVILFGTHASLSVKKELLQPEQFAANETVTLKTPKGSIPKVRIIGPLRDYSQVEISKTDAYLLGINPPIRDSGKLKGSAFITIVGPVGELALEEGCIIATRHIHISPDYMEKWGLKKGDQVQVIVPGPRGGVLNHVQIKAEKSYALELHLDTDDANAHLIKQGDLLEVKKEDADLE